MKKAIYYVTVNSNAVPQGFGAHFLELPAPPDLEAALRDAITDLRCKIVYVLGRGDSLDADDMADRCEAYATMIEMVQYMELLTPDDKTKDIRVAGAKIGWITIEQIPVFSNQHKSAEHRLKLVA